ncbi:MAG: hypothetical protein WBO45_18620 [Planctomycetota bacterium]
MLDVRDLAKSLLVAPIELVREMQADCVPLMRLSAKRWRVAEGDYSAWIERRKAKAADMAAQRRLRMGHVAGKATPPKSPQPKVRFRR